MRSHLPTMIVLSLFIGPVAAAGELAVNPSGSCVATANGSSACPMAGPETKQNRHEAMCARMQALRASMSGARRPSSAAAPSP